MRSSSTARDTLEQARFFLTRATEVADSDRVALGHFLEASIVFGRSVTLHLQKEFAHVEGFAEWYEPQRDRMGRDPLLRFFLEKRNYILKRGRLGVRKTVALSLRSTIQVTASVRIKVKRGTPWYRRSPQILLQDAAAPMRRWVSNWRRLTRVRSIQAPRDEETQVRESWHFDDPERRDEPALDLMTQYLDLLDEVVSQAEARFPLADPTSS